MLLPCVVAALALLTAAPCAAQFARPRSSVVTYELKGAAKPDLPPVLSSLSAFQRWTPAQMRRPLTHFASFDPFAGKGAMAYTSSYQQPWPNVRRGFVRYASEGLMEEKARAREEAPIGTDPQSQFDPLQPALGAQHEMPLMPMRRLAKRNANLGDGRLME